MLYIVDEAGLNLKGLSVVKFSAEWCAPCKRMETLLKKMEGEFPEIAFYDVDIDKCNSLAKEYKIKTLPTLIFFSDKKEKHKVAGVILTEPLRKLLKELRK